MGVVGAEFSGKLVECDWRLVGRWGIWKKLIKAVSGSGGDYVVQRPQGAYDVAVAGELED
jgi:hypothetical protein